MMTPAQHKIFIEETNAHTEKVIKEAVNGKIDSFRIEMRDTLKEQNKAIQPALDAIASWNAGSRAFRWAFGLFMSVGALYFMFIKIFKS